jgi:potassium channel subfamily K
MVATSLNFTPTTDQEHPASPISPNSPLTLTPGGQKSSTTALPGTDISPNNTPLEQDLATPLSASTGTTLLSPAPIRRNTRTNTIKISNPQHHELGINFKGKLHALPHHILERVHRARTLVAAGRKDNIHKPEPEGDAKHGNRKVSAHMVNYKNIFMLQHRLKFCCHILNVSFFCNRRERFISRFHCVGYLQEIDAAAKDALDLTIHRHLDHDH